MNTFLFVWAAGIMFFIINIVILSELVRHYNGTHPVNVVKSD